jgi:hypothetical protein
MTYRSKLEDRIAKKEQEIRELEAKIREERAYVQALKDSIKLLPRMADDTGDDSRSMGVRPGSLVGKALDALRSAGKPLHVTVLLHAIGEETTRGKRGALSGSLSAYVRRRELFTRPAPNTFGLLEWSASDEPPDDFGRED